MIRSLALALALPLLAACSADFEDAAPTLDDYGALWREHCGRSGPPANDVATACGPDSIYVDCDGDGYGGAEHAEPCTSILPPGFAKNADDCDDRDPSAWRVAHVDPDGDGYGDAAICVPDVLPEGSAGPGGDCDESDPSINPGRPEQWRDSVDSDCDGADDPYACGPADPARAPDCACDRFSSDEPLAIDPACPAAADLVVADVVACEAGGCADSVYVRLGNQGSVEASPPLAVHLLGSIHELTSSLAPGQRSRWISLTGAAAGAALVTVTAGGVECSTANNTAEVTIGSRCTVP